MLTVLPFPYWIWLFIILPVQRFWLNQKYTCISALIPGFVRHNFARSAILTKSEINLHSSSNTGISKTKEHTSVIGKQRDDRLQYCARYRWGRSKIMGDPVRIHNLVFFFHTCWQRTFSVHMQTVMSLRTIQVCHGTLASLRTLQVCHGTLARTYICWNTDYSSFCQV